MLRWKQYKRLLHVPHYPLLGSPWLPFQNTKGHFRKKSRFASNAKCIQRKNIEKCINVWYEIWYSTAIDYRIMIDIFQNHEFRFFTNVLERQSIWSIIGVSLISPIVHFWYQIYIHRTKFLMLILCNWISHAYQITLKNS